MLRAAFRLFAQTLQSFRHRMCASHRVQQRFTVRVSFSSKETQKHHMYKLHACAVLPCAHTVTVMMGVWHFHKGCTLYDADCAPLTSDPNDTEPTCGAQLLLSSQRTTSSYRGLQSWRQLWRTWSPAGGCRCCWPPCPVQMPARLSTGPKPCSLTLATQLSSRLLFSRLQRVSGLSGVPCNLGPIWKCSFAEPLQRHARCSPCCCKDCCLCFTCVCVCLATGYDHLNMLLAGFRSRCHYCSVEGSASLAEAESLHELSPQNSLHGCRLRHERHVLR